MIAAYFKIKPRPRRFRESKEEDQWWETIEEKYARQDLGGFAMESGGLLRIEEKKA